MTEAVRAGLTDEVVVGRWVRATPGLRELIDTASSAGLELQDRDRSALDELGPNHQGVAARVRTPAPLTEGDLLSRHFDDDDALVLLDGVTDPHNLGAAARAAEGAGAAALIVRERRSAPVTAAAVRASAGALLHLPVARVTNLRRIIDRLKDAQFTVVGLDGDAPASIYDDPCPDGRVVLIVGSEGAGLSRLVREGCDLLVSLPMRGTVDSLNASSALAAALFGYVLPSRNRWR